MTREEYYARILAQAIDPTNGNLLAADGRGGLLFFRMESALSRGAIHPRSPDICVKRRKSVCSMLSMGSVVIAGDVDAQLFAYSWNDLDMETNPEPLFSMAAFGDGTLSTAMNEVNALATLDDERFIHAGSGDYSIRVRDLNSPRSIVASYQGHTDTVNALAVQSPNQWLSASDDGSVRLWDQRVGRQSVQAIFPFRQSQLHRPRMGKAVTVVASDSQWMVCGGGVDLAIWHLGTLSVAAHLPTDGEQYHHALLLNEDRILIGGSSPQLYQFDFTGRSINSIVTSMNAIFSIQSAEKQRLITVAGESAMIDVFLTLGYKSFSFNTIMSTE